jgi:hypothetical protein
MVCLLVAALAVGSGLVAAAQTKQSVKVAPAQPTLSQEEMSEARQRLGELGYWVRLDLVGKDLSLRHALIAFQKIEGRPRTGVLTREELQALRGAQRPSVRENGFPHIEIDLCRQVLFVVDCCGAILRILPISTGSGECFTQGGSTRRAVTPAGRFTVKRKLDGWHKSPLGLLYYPNYIYGGVAIHGSPSVPVDPASPGCIRIPMFAAKEFSQMATLGMVVLLYDDRTIAPKALP